MSNPLEEYNKLKAAIERIRRATVHSDLNWNHPCYLNTTEESRKLAWENDLLCIVKQHIQCLEAIEGIR